MRKYAAIPALVFILAAMAASAQSYRLVSPDGHLEALISAKDSLSFSVMKEGQVLIPSVAVSMTVNGRQIPGRNDRARMDHQSVHDVIRPVVAIRNSLIKDDYNKLVLRYKTHFSVVFRAYDDAIAYRFITDYPDSVTVKDERCNMSLPSGAGGWFAFSGRWMNSYEHLYQKMAVDSIDGARTIQLPLLLDLKAGRKVLVTESDLYDYPGLYFTGNSDGSLRSIFPPAVKTERKNVRGKGGWDRIFFPASTYDYLARTAGSRGFPWRIFAVSDSDAGLLDNDIVYKLGEPNRIHDSSWIKPGEVAWDWWNDWNITGVDFRAGVNTKTYEYYIDFAAKNHIPYIIMDEGWYQLGNIMERTADVDVKQIAAYGKSKGVGVILWCVWRTLDEQMQQAMDLFDSWGIKGVKVDFMNRDDQAVVDFYWRCAKAAAAHHLLVDFHGAHKPAGLMRTYPNVVNFEGVPGLEQDKWTDSMTTPWMAVTLPYIRMFAGPMDYTPGAMRNAQLKDFAPINSNPMSLGTRCQQLAMYVIFNAPLQMLADNPTAYMKNKPCLDFITTVPTTWDQTIPLAGSVGEYVAVAKRKGGEFFAAAMTNWKPRDVTLDFSFLPPGTYKMVLFQDGVNADRNGTDYKRVERTITRDDKITVHLAPGGGWAARIYR
jgi:alpha-glucosidase